MRFLMRWAQYEDLLWTWEEVMKKGMLILRKAGFESVEDLPRIAVGLSQNAYRDLTPQLGTSNGEERVPVLVPTAQGLRT